MSAHLLGITGVWGIAAAQTGIILYDQSLDYKHKDKEILDLTGNPCGLSLYAETVELKLSGLVPSASPFAAKLGSVLTLANAMPVHLNSPVGGTIIIMGIQRSLNNEDWEKIDVNATFYPALTAA